MKIRNTCRAALLVLLSLPAAATAQVAIYSLSFEETGPNINYRSYDGGYMVAPADGGEADFVLLLGQGGSQQYVSASGLGQFFIATEGDERKGVLANADSTDTPVQFFMAIGDLDTTISADSTSTDDTTGETTVTTASESVPRRLEGTVVTADDTGTSTGVFDANTGSAGASQLTADLDLVRTTEANQQEFSVDQAVADLVAEMESVGITEFALSFDSETDTTTTDETTTN